LIQYRFLRTDTKHNIANRFASF